MADADLDEEETPEPWRPNITVLDNPEAFGYKVFSPRARRGSRRRGTVTRRKSSSGCARSSTRSCATLSGAVARLANKLQRQLMAQQNRAWDFDLEEGMLDAARLTRIITDPMHALSFKRERDTDFRDTVVTLAAR